MYTAKRVASGGNTQLFSKTGRLKVRIGMDTGK